MKAFLKLAGGAALLFAAAIVVFHDVRGSGAESQSNKLEIYCLWNEGEPYADWLADAARRFADQRGGLDVEIVTAGREVMGKLRPRLIIGNPPDLVNQGDGMFLQLMRDGLLEPLEGSLDGPAWDGKERWRDTFRDGIIETVRTDGHDYLIPWGLTTTLVFYNKGMFEKLGLAAPETWDELLHVCQVLKDNGIEPIASDGTQPGYNASWYTSMIRRVTTYQHYLDTAFGRDDTSWLEPRWLEGAKRICELRDKGYIMQGYEGSMWPSAQMQWMQGKCGMIQCGTWLPVEMRDSTQPGFRMGIFRFPRVEGFDDTDWNAQEVSTGVFAVPKEARHKAVAIDFLRFITSRDEMRRIVALDNISAVKGVEMPESMKGLDALLSPPYKVVASDMSTEFADWWRQVGRERMSRLWLGQYAPDAFVKEMDRAQRDYDARQAMLASRRK